MGTPQSQPVYVRPRPVQFEQIQANPQCYPYNYRPTTVGSWETTAHGKLMKSRNLSSTYVLCGTINRNPPNNSLEFPCPSCSTPIFDGGLCKKVVCRCTKSLIRNESNEIQ